MYKVLITSHAERELKRLDRSTKNRILPVALALADNPRPHGCLKVKSEGRLWRIRVDGGDTPPLLPPEDSDRP